MRTLGIVCSNVYPLFSNSTTHTWGGMETRAGTIGIEINKSSLWDVFFVVSDFNQPFHCVLKDIDFFIYQSTYRQAGRNVFPRFRKHWWFPAINLDRSDLDLIWQIPLLISWMLLPGFFSQQFWRKQNPELVCCFGNNALSAEVIADCRRNGIRTVLCLASDKDLSPDYLPGNRQHNHYGMAKWKGYFSLTNADHIIVQTEHQRSELMRHFGRSGDIVRNPVHVSVTDPASWPLRSSRKFVLWIGRTDDYNKRPKIFMELARSLPELRFVMIASRTNDAVFKELLDNCPNNLTMLCQQPAQTIPEYLRDALVLVNTSKFEGFPNTFLQAAVAGTPIVSFEVDPDEMLSKHSCGVVAGGDINALQQHILEFCTDHQYAERVALASHSYVLQNHDMEGRIHEFLTLLEKYDSTPPPRIPWWRKWKRFAHQAAEATLGH